MFKNKIGLDSSISKFIYFKIRRRDGVESGEFKVPIDGCIRNSYIKIQGKAQLSDKHAWYFSNSILTMNFKGKSFGL